MNKFKFLSNEIALDLLHSLTKYLVYFMKFSHVFKWQLKHWNLFVRDFKNYNNKLQESKRYTVYIKIL